MSTSMLGARQKSLTQRSPVFVPLRTGVLVACLGYWLSRKAFRPLLLPYGPPRALTERPSYGPLDTNNDLLMLKHGKLTKIYERLQPGEKPMMLGTETIFMHENGTMFSATAEGNLISIGDVQTDETGRTTAKTTFVKDLGNGRPLSGKFIGDILYVVDAFQGLLRVQNVFDPKCKVEIVASTAIDNDDGRVTRINFADDVAIGPRSGKIYFTDATGIPPFLNRDLSWEVLYSSKLEFMRGPSGRLLQYDPNTDKVTVLLKDLYFANGVAVAEDETFVMVVETFYSRVTKLYLSGDKAGRTEFVINGDPSPAWFDGLDCAWKRFGSQTEHCYVIGVAKVDPLAKVKYYSGIVILDPVRSTFVGIIQDPKGTDIKTMTSVTFFQNKIYLGSLDNDYIAVYDLAE